MSENGNYHTVPPVLQLLWFYAPPGKLPSDSENPHFRQKPCHQTSI